MAKTTKKELRVVVCPFGPVGDPDISEASSALHSGGAIAAFPITRSMCLARRTKSYFSGCEDCGWWAKRRKFAVEVIDVARKHSGILEKGIKCPECGKKEVIRVNGKGGDFLMCMSGDCSWDKGEPFHRPPADDEINRSGKRPRTKKKKKPVKKSAAGVAPKAGGGSSTGQKVKTKKGKTRSTGVGDKVALALAKCETIADMVKYAKKVGIPDAKKYMSLPNPGLARMAIGNRARGILRKQGKL